jgi:mycothiol system anti-sigma-R factor
MAEVQPHDHDGLDHAGSGGHTGHDHDVRDHDDVHDHDVHDHGGNCDEALAELYTFLDGELTEQKRSAITHHLDDCSPCLEIYDFEAELRLVIKHRCADAVPDTLRSRVAEQLAALEGELPGPAGTDASA